MSHLPNLSLRANSRNPHQSRLVSRPLHTLALKFRGDFRNPHQSRTISHPHHPPPPHLTPVSEVIVETPIKVVQSLTLIKTVSIIL